MNDKAGHGNHGESTVVDFLSLHLLQFGCILRLESKRIEFQVTWHVIFLQKSGLVNWAVSGVDPSSLGTRSLSSSNKGNDYRPESVRDLGDVGDGRSADLCIKKEGAT